MRKVFGISLAILFATTLFWSLESKAQNLPSLLRQGNTTQFILDGKPFLILGGELRNSASGTAEQADSIVPKLARAHVNTILTPVSWELIEPTEGTFDFSILDHWIAVARDQHVHLILLWFGSWKNGTSSYVPAWVKQDAKRFPCAVGTDGRELEVLSTFSQNNLHADEKAFRELMRHLKQTDAQQQTVLMVQVENEVGIGGSTRDRSPEADRLFRSSIPEPLIRDLKQHRERLSPELLKTWRGTAGAWSEAFGNDASASEIFMAWHYASYIGQVAAAGKAEYALPMYVNAQLPAPLERPGEYPSGGPHPSYLEVWRAAAPAIDFYSPDIYWPNFDYWCERYSENDNPLFIPEVRYEASPFSAFYAFGEARAFGFSPFAIDNIPDPTSAPEAASKNDLVSAYSVLYQLSELLPQAQREGRTRAIVLHTTSLRPSQTVSLDGYLFQAALTRSYPANVIEQIDGAMLVLEQSPGDFLIGGSALRITVTKDFDQSAGSAGIASVEEGAFLNGQWKTTARLNGDENNQGRTIFLPAHEFKLLRVKLYMLP
jgi:beta-galactosidase GanA